MENGIPQKIVAFYRIRKKEVLKEEAAVPTAAAPPKVKFVPESFRNFLFFFELHDPMPKVDEALDYFFKEVFQRGDRVTIVTPKGAYRFRQDSFNRTVLGEVSRQIKGNLRRDILQGAADYRNLIQEIKDISSSEFPGDVGAAVIENDIRQLRDRLTVSDQDVRLLAQTLRVQEGQKIIFLFYQKEEIVIPGSQYETSKFAGENFRPIDYNVDDIQKIFADASLTVNLVFLTNSTTDTFDVEDLRRGDFSLIDLSHSLYGAFREMSQASGGTTEASTNALAAFKKTVTGSENYYLLYYVPAAYKADGKFKEIEVTVKGRHYEVSHRSGYVAN